MAQRRDREEATDVDEATLLATKYPFAERIALSEREITAQMTRIAGEMHAHYAGKVSAASPLVVVCVLKGSAPAHTILCRELARLGVPHVADYICVSSYGASSKSSGEVRMLLDLRASILDHHLVVVEDICESGRTLEFLCKVFACRRPASVELVALLDKPDCRKVVGVQPRWVGKTLPDDGSFLVGGGLDWAEKWRTLPDVVVLKPEVYAAKPHHQE